MSIENMWLVAFVALAALSCSDHRQDEASPEETRAEVAAPAQDASVDIMPSNVPKGSMKTVGSVFTVLGLEIPEGMLPQKGPAKVFRFEGVLPVAQLTEKMREQIRPKWSKKSGSGHVFEEARVRIPKGGSDGKSLLNVRIFKRAGGGSVLDIWIAHTLESGSSKEVMHSTSLRGPSTAQREKRNKERADTVRAMNKAARGQEFTPADRKSGFFH